ncbi:MAG: bifunctional isocitrate dehydrogenase kinase/phosphatase [Gammaproteobacteria bacterium]|nr:bifunctional isocitrate dehydrogenase kinase/phosphatase [Gammaproteobacteria bacterium]
MTSQPTSHPTQEQARTDKLGSRIALLICSGFQAYRAEFQAVTVGARARFENRDWTSVQRAGQERLAIYRQHLEGVTAAIGEVLSTDFDPVLWRETKAAYLRLIRTEYNAELFETFYNSVHREITQDSAVSDAEMFVTSLFANPPVPPKRPIFNSYDTDQGILDLARTILTDFGFTMPWQNLQRDVKNILRSMAEQRADILDSKGLRLDILRGVFYRNKGAYLIGRVRHTRDATERLWPLALPLLLDESGRLYLDALISDEDELSVMFSFTRAYFMVHTEHPCALVDFLQTLLPNKKRAELYASIGLHKHGKTVFYRDFLDHLAHSDDPFIIAPGTRGMVMSVFSLPSLQTVFKVIKDEFAAPKSITPKQVREKYHVVKRHDRVGRMADTQEFENLTFPRSRFDPELLTELQTVAASSVTLTDDEVLIKHLYTERLMTPLNLYIETAPDSELRDVLDEYGTAIKQLAAANIFPGDMLLKNFGVTRHGRVVFYDYDEICYLTDVNFRALPVARTLEDEMSAEPWFSVATNDVFPEEFRRFLFGRKRIKQLFTEMHGELFDPEYWRNVQQAIISGHVMDVFPYRREKRFALAQPSPNESTGDQ